MGDYTWKPIEPLGDAERQIDLAAMRPPYKSWRAAKKRVQLSSGPGLSAFDQRLLRRLSIETGILERLYELDRGTTGALVANGLVLACEIKSSAKILNLRD